MKNVTFQEAIRNKQSLMASRKEYNRENNTNMTMVNYLHNVLNYPMDEAEMIKNRIYKKKNASVRV